MPRRLVSEVRIDMGTTLQPDALSREVSAEIEVMFRQGAKSVRVDRPTPSIADVRVLEWAEVTSDAR